MFDKYTAMTGKVPFVLLMVIFSIVSCSDLQIRSMPIPPSSTKLRVFVNPISSNLPMGQWKTPHDVFASNLYDSTQQLLSGKDIYQVVPREDVQTVMGNQSLGGWQWEKNDWVLAKQMGQVLYADYTLIIERGFFNLFYIRMVLVNTETGKSYETFYNIRPANGAGADELMEEHKKIIHLSFGQIFAKAKGDMLATAIRKGKVDSTANAPISQGDGSMESSAYAQAPQSPPKPSLQKDNESDFSGPVLSQKKEPHITSPKAEVDNMSAKKEKMKLVVYDFNATDNLRVAAIILSESLREELHKNGKFELVNRENIGQVMDELKLQQTGLVAEKDAIRIGQWMAANETITGNLAVIGSALILQAKRTDVATMTTLSLGSLRTNVDKVERFLDEMHALAMVLSK